MTIIWHPLFLPISILTLGALALPLARQRRWSAPLAAALAGAALVSLGALGRRLPLEGVVSFWRPLAVFGTPLTFGLQEGNWGLAMALVTSSALTLLARCCDTSRPSPVQAALVLACTAAGVAALSATSFVTLILAWGLIDLLTAAMLAHYGPRGARRGVLTLVNGGLGAGALWAATLLAQPEGVSGFLRLAHFDGRAAALLQVAVILRLGLVPVHLWRPIDVGVSPAQLLPVVVIPTLLGFDLLTFLPALTAGLPPTLFALAAATALVGGFGAWSESDERRGLMGLVLAETGLAVLAVANAGQQAIATARVAAIAWALGSTVVALTPGWSGRRFWRGLPSLVALLSLLGLPATLGFVVRLTIYSGLEADLLALVVALLGESFALAALLRFWLWGEQASLPHRPVWEGVYLGLFGLAGAALVVTGLTPERFVRHGAGAGGGLPTLSEMMRQGGVTGWAGWAIPLVAGLTLFIAGEGLRQRLEGGWRGLGALLRLEWVYGLVYLAGRGGARLIRGLSTVVEAEGALLWTIVFILMVVLFLTNGGAGPGG